MTDRSFEEFDRARRRHPASMQRTVTTPPALALQLVTPCEWVGRPCDMKASHRVVTYGRSGMIIEDRLLCGVHALTTCTAQDATGYRVDTALLRAAGGDVYDQLLAVPELEGER